MSGFQLGIIAFCAVCGVILLVSLIFLAMSGKPVAVSQPRPRATQEHIPEHRREAPPAPPFVAQAEPVPATHTLTAMLQGIDQELAEEARLNRTRNAAVKLYRYAYDLDAPGLPKP